ncbi:hypothetical protein [uncultured Corynebacterium sp.]|uniref:hypothetical protein n=1 Tax=uncultured Corynebacterium sp. TaxID=159447 RepID=UPI0025D43FCB|nr:hypothetical protein [uncultured Corynebacterium sp.]
MNTEAGATGVVTNEPAEGTLIFVSEKGSFTFTPNKDFSGTADPVMTTAAAEEIQGRRAGD